MRARGLVLAGAAALALVGAAAMRIGAQRGYDGYVQSGNLNDIKNTAYDGRFTFVRVRFNPLCCDRGYGRVDRKWDHDTPRAERNFEKIMREITLLRPYMEGSNILAFDDPELMKYPVAYVSEPGFWTVSDKEIEGARNYLNKGGFLIFDDFTGPHWYNFESVLRQILPQVRLVRLDTSHPIFDSFFHITSLDYTHPYSGTKSEFWGVYEDNDPTKRLILVANYNNDLGDYMEFSDQGFLPIALSNEAYKIMVNYVIYAMTR